MGCWKIWPFFDRANEFFEVEVISLGPYGYGIPKGNDDMSRLLYVYRPKMGQEHGNGS